MLIFEKNKDFPNILLKKAAINSLNEVILANCAALNEVILVSDQKIIRNSAEFLPKNFIDSFEQSLIFKNPYASEDFVKQISHKAKKSKLIIGFGSGTINDLCKIAAANLEIPYVIIASAPSMNGYLSKNASIAIKGHKKTLRATLPRAVIADFDIIKNAPKRLIKAGIGDSLCFYGCWFDWYLSHQILGTRFDDKLFLMQKDKIDYFIKNHQF